jgi:hypothetical protein
MLVKMNTAPSDLRIRGCMGHMVSGRFMRLRDIEVGVTHILRKGWHLGN